MFVLTTGPNDGLGLTDADFAAGRQARDFEHLHVLDGQHVLSLHETQAHTDLGDLSNRRERRIDRR